MYESSIEKYITDLSYFFGFRFIPCKICIMNWDLVQRHKNFLMLFGILEIISAMLKKKAFFFIHRICEEKTFYPEFAFCIYVAYWRFHSYLAKELVLYDLISDEVLLYCFEYFCDYNKNVSEFCLKKCLINKSVEKGVFTEYMDGTINFREYFYDIHNFICEKIEKYIAYKKFERVKWIYCLVPFDENTMKSILYNNHLSLNSHLVKNILYYDFECY